MSQFARSFAAVIVLLASGLGFAAPSMGPVPSSSAMSCCHKACCSAMAACSTGGACALNGSAAKTSPNGSCLRSGPCDRQPATILSSNFDPAVFARAPKQIAEPAAERLILPLRAGPNDLAPAPPDQPPRS